MQKEAGIWGCYVTILGSRQQSVWITAVRLAGVARSSVLAEHAVVVAQSKGGRKWE